MIKSCGKQLKPFDKPATELQIFYPYLQMSSIFSQTYTTILTQLTFICLKSAIEKGVRYVQS